MQTPLIITNENTSNIQNTQQQSLDQIKLRIADFDKAYAFTGPETRTQKAEELEKIYAEIVKNKDSSKDTMGCIASILYHYAGAIFHSDFVGAKSLSLAAMSYLRIPLGLSKHIFPFATLKDFYEELKKHPERYTDPDALQIVEMVEKATTDEKRLFLAKIFRQLAGCLQNIDAYSEKSYEKGELFERLYEAAIALLSSIEKPDQHTHKMLAEVQYNLYPDLVERRDPKNLEAILAAYDKALELDLSDEMRARVANIRACTVGSKDWNRTAKYLDEALEYQKKVVNFSEFVKANTHSSRALVELRLSDCNLEKAEKFIAVALQHSAHERSFDRDHQYFASYDMNAARIAMAKKDANSAEKHLKQARTTLEKYPGSNKSDMTTLQKVEEELKILKSSLSK